MSDIIRAHDPEWAGKFQIEADLLKSIIRANAHLVEHIGSTSIPGIFTKPVIDILIGVEDLGAVDQCVGEMEIQGYEAKGSYGLEGRRYFRKSNDVGVRTHHVHIFQMGSPDLVRHLAFRDYLTAHPDKATEYSNYKRDITNQAGMTRKRYQDMKQECVDRLDREAQAWLETLKSMPKPSAKSA